MNATAAVLTGQQHVVHHIHTAVLLCGDRPGHRLLPLGVRERDLPISRLLGGQAPGEGQRAFESSPSHLQGSVSNACF
jgi:hypothetical protein